MPRLNLQVTYGGVVVDGQEMTKAEVPPVCQRALLRPHPSCFFFTVHPRQPQIDSGSWTTDHQNCTDRYSSQFENNYYFAEM